RLFLEIEGGGRRLRGPLKPCGIPRIVGSRLAVAHRPEEVDHRHEIADREYSGSGGREHIEYLVLGRILIIPARHAEITQDELREEREIESDEDDESGEPCPSLGVEPAGNFRPPEMHA